MSTPQPTPQPPAGQQPSASNAPIQVRPVRAAFGPAVSLVSVDEQGRLWMRVSTAAGIMIAGLVMFLVPLAAMWWVGAGLVGSGQITITNHPEPPAPSNTLAPAGKNP